MTMSEFLESAVLPDRIERLSQHYFYECFQLESKYAFDN